MAERRDAVVVGAGPNGLAAAITLARAGRSVTLVEAADQIGGGTRSAELTLPGFVHDVCSAVHPLVAASPFFRSLRLADHGLELVHPPTPLAHPLDGVRAAALERDLDATGATLGWDGPAWSALMGPLVRHADDIIDAALQPLGVPRRPLGPLLFAAHALSSATGLAARRFRAEPAKALLGGICAHAIQPLSQPPTAAVGLMLGLLGHAVGWPVARGGARAIADALGKELTALGGEIVTGERVTGLAQLPPSEAVLFDLSPRQVLAICGDRFPPGYRRRLARYRYGPGVFKVDWALDGPVPWAAQVCRRAGTVHVGGTLAEIAAGEADVVAGRHPDRPFVLVAQPGVCDPTRAPAGKDTLWGYCHVPHGSRVDMTDAIERQIERFAPGFRDLILARHTMDTAAVEAHDANYVGGDINAGIQDLRQLFTRPTARWPVQSTPDPRLWFCSSSTPPGGGVHGMCGQRAANSLLARQRRAGRAR